MAEYAVKTHAVSIRVACQAFRVSQACYRYTPKGDEQNKEIADWLVRLTNTHRVWGFGLCFLYLHKGQKQVKGLIWNHKRVYRIYCELELNLQIKPHKRLVRQVPVPLSVLEGVNPSYYTHLFTVPPLPCAAWSQESSATP